MLAVWVQQIEQLAAFLFDRLAMVHNPQASRISTAPSF
jgi:hypothetical protein